MNTVIAAEQFNVDNNYTVTRSGSAGRAEKVSYFFNVPAGTPAFKVDVTAGANSRVRLLRFHPYGVPFDSLSTTGYQTGGTQSRTVSNPQPGVWEVAVDASRSAPDMVSTFSVTASLLGVVITPALWTVSPYTLNTAYSQVFTFRNDFGTYEGGEVGSALGSAITRRPSIAGGAVQEFTVNVPAGSTELFVKIGNTADPAADLDLYLFRPDGSFAAQNADGDSEEQIRYTPAGGLATGEWTVVVDGFAVPAGTTAYDYLDAFANPVFGNVTVAGGAAGPRPNGTWTRTATALAAANPATGRFLQGFVQALGREMRCSDPPRCS